MTVRTEHYQGALKFKANYIGDQLDGSVEWFYPNGCRSLNINYLKGKGAHGLLKAWHNNGALKTCIDYKKGKKHGHETHWAAEGKVTSKEYWIEGKSVTKEECNVRI